MRALMCQPQEMKNMSNEEAFTVCHCPGKGLARGSHAQGGPVSVSLEVQCPHGYRALGIFHTHPGGHPVLSAADKKEARRLGLKHMCVGVPDTGEIRCMEV